MAEWKLDSDCVWLVMTLTLGGRSGRSGEGSQLVVRRVCLGESIRFCKLARAGRVSISWLSCGLLIARVRLCGDRGSAGSWLGKLMFP